MGSASIMPASLADELPLPDEAPTAGLLAGAREGVNRKIVVLDNDPDGVQTVHDLPVYTDWRRGTLESGLAEEGAMFFVLTDSRGFSRRETERAHREIAENLLAESEKTGVPFLLVSRGTPPLPTRHPTCWTGARSGQTDDAQGNLNLSVRISEALASVVGELTVLSPGVWRQLC